MRTTQQLSITLLKEMADVVKSKVRTGEYASESEVIRDGLEVIADTESCRRKLAASSGWAHLRCAQSRSVSCSHSGASTRLLGYRARQDPMNYRVVFSPEVLEQLAERYRYVAQAASPNIAAGYRGSKPNPAKILDGRANFEKF